MQTFLPLPSFQDSARVLDPSRLGNQVYREGMTLLRGGWPHHPAARLWAGYRDALAAYLWAGVLELLERGRDYRARPWAVEIQTFSLHDPPLPPWLGDEQLHSSHRAALLFKNFEWYSQFGWTEEPQMAYFWPVGETPCSKS
jgi:hypothetical protein